jgi:signal-transduction protein with cAMP-binding, CBS, and nucleotidyltransferase domain
MAAFEQNLNYICKHPSFKDLPDQIQRELALCAYPVHYDSDTVIIKENSMQDCLFIIQEGIVEVKK